MTSTPAVENVKAALRREVLARRDALPANVRAAAAEVIAVRPFPLPATPGAIVSGFMPLKTEIDPLPLLNRLRERGAPWHRDEAAPCRSRRQRTFAPSCPPCAGIHVLSAPT